MEIIAIVISGIFGTFIMTLFISFISAIVNYNIRVPAILGTMVTMRTKPSGDVSRSLSTLTIGNIIHYAIGIVFASAYYGAMEFMRFPNTFLNAMFFGLLAGVCAVVFWLTFIKLHPLAPAIKVPLYLSFIFVGHFLFALGVWFSLTISTLRITF